MVRVIGGSARGRPLRAPRSAGVRPTADRVREAMFDVLAHLGAVSRARVLDAFAGSGALGIEALSRGAESVTFVEADRRVAAVVEENLAATGFSNSPAVRIVRGDALGYLAGAREHFDLALLDPPYAFAEWDRLLERCAAALVVIESDRPVPLPAHLALHRSYRYGTTLLAVARALPVHAAAHDARGEGAAPVRGSEPAGAARKERS